MLTKPNSYQLVLENGQLILRLLPGLTEAPWSEIEQAGFEAVSEVQKLSKPQVVVDLTQLSYIGSSQVALVIRVWKAVKVQDGALVVATSNSTVREVLALSGLDRVWKLVETSQEAQAALGRRDIQPTLDNDQSDASPSRPMHCWRPVSWEFWVSLLTGWMRLHQGESCWLPVVSWHLLPASGDC